MKIFVFDIETVPDVQSGKKLLDLEGLTDLEIAQAMFTKAKADTGKTFIRHHLQKIVAISAVFRNNDTLKVWSLGETGSSEAELIERFFRGLDKFMPTLVSWNGRRALIYRFYIIELYYMVLLRLLIGRQERVIINLNGIII